MKPELWTPTAPEVNELQALLRRLESVTEIMTSEQNRLETATSTVTDLTLAHLEYLREQQQLSKKLISDRFDQPPHLKQQRELLTSIPSLGDLTAFVLLAEIGEVSDYDNARQLAAYADLTQA
jgi:transposase